MKPVSDNMQKYENYKEQMKRLKSALEHKFFLEAIFIEYAIIEDRLESALRHSGKWNPKPGKHTMIGQKIKLILQLPEKGESLAEKYFSLELIQQILDWKDRRNPLIHDLMQQFIHTEELAALAQEGFVLVKQLSNKVSLFNKAIERKNNRRGR